MLIVLLCSFFVVAVILYCILYYTVYMEFVHVEGLLSGSVKSTGEATPVKVKLNE